MSNGNVLFTPSIFAKLVAMNLGDELNVVRNLSTQYTKEFGNKTAQVGQQISATKPARFIPVQNNLAYTAQPLAKQKFNITVDQTSSVYFGWDTMEATFTIEDINRDYARPVAIALASDVNYRIAKYVALNTFNSVGTPGVNPNAVATYLAAKSKLVRQGMPAKSPLNYVITDAMSATMVDAEKGFFNAQGIISRQLETGRMQDQLGGMYATDETLYAHTTGAQGGTPLVNGANQTSADGNNGTGTLTIDGATASTLIAKAGDVFTLPATGAFPGTFSLHPQTRQSTGDLQQFVLLADVTTSGTGTATLSFSPAITPANGSNQFANVTAAPVDNNAITFWGGASDASKVAKQGLLLHRDSFAFMSVPLENPKSGEGAIAERSTDPDTGITVAIIRYFDGDSRTWRTRFDTCFGVAPVYRELACRIQAGA